MNKSEEAQTRIAGGTHFTETATLRHPFMCLINHLTLMLRKAAKIIKDQPLGISGHFPRRSR